MDNDVSTAATIESLRQQLDAARAYIDGQDFRSDFRTAGEMRQALNASQAREAAYRADVVRLTTEREEWRKINENQSILVMLTEAELTRERSRADVLAAEVRAWRYQCVQEQCEGGDVDGADCRLNAAMAATDSTNALDPAKFEVKP